jgi:hypothetical protein
MAIICSGSLGDADLSISQSQYLPDPPYHGRRYLYCYSSTWQLFAGAQSQYWHHGTSNEDRMVQTASKFTQFIINSHRPEHIVVMCCHRNNHPYTNVGIMGRLLTIT